MDTLHLPNSNLCVAIGTGTLTGPPVLAPGLAHEAFVYSHTCSQVGKSVDEMR